MAVNLQAPSPAGLYPVAGVKIGVTEAGVRKANRKDLSVVLLDEGASVAGVFTQNRYCAAPVQICRDNLQRSLGNSLGIRAMLINTGNANAGTGADGMARARATCIALARKLDIAPEQILPFSTGVIMEPLPAGRIEAGIPDALLDAKEDNWARAAEGIMTTDTVPKAFSRQVLIGGKTVTITGISKGAGMIRPNMATIPGAFACRCWNGTDEKLEVTSWLPDSIAIVASGCDMVKVRVSSRPCWPTPNSFSAAICSRMAWFETFTAGMAMRCFSV